MKRLLPFLLLPVLAFADGATQADFYTLKSRIQTELQNMSGSYSVIENAASGGIRELSGVDPNSSEYVRCQSAIGYFSTILSTSSDLRSQLSYVQTLVSALEPTNSVSSADYTAILNQMNQRLLNIYGQLEDVNYRIYHDIQPRLDAIIEAVESIDAYVGEILRVLNDIKTILNQKLVPLCDWMLDVNGTYQQFYSNAVVRIQSLDANVQSDLAEMWRQTLYNYSNITEVVFGEGGDVSSRYSLSDQLSSVHVGDDFRLSNEGYIALQNLAMNERQYLCTIEALNLLRSNTNGVNAQVHWITNYLDKVQAPFYRLFDQYAYLNNPPQNIFALSNIEKFTNFAFSVSSNGRLNTFREWKGHRANTNWFTRVETYLLNMQGLLYDTSLDQESTSSLLDSENFERNLRYATNEFNNVITEYADISNKFNEVASHFKLFVNAWDMGDSAGGWEPITLLPSFELGGIQIEHIHLTAQNFDFIAESVRTVFSSIWYLVFGFIGFKYILLLVFLIGRTISRICLLVATLLH